MSERVEQAMTGGATIAKKSLVALIVVLLVVFWALVLAYFSFFTIREDQQVVVTRFGKPVGDPIREAGLHYRVPIIDQVTFFDKRFLEHDSMSSEIITLDRKFLNVVYSYRWRIVDPLKFLQTVRNKVGARARLDDIIYSELRLELGQKESSEIMTTERAGVMNSITKRSDAMARKYGIEIADVRLKRIKPSW